MELFPSREDFTLAVVGSFSNRSAKIVQWCCRESHQKSGELYHLAVKLDRNQRWLSSKEFLRSEYGIVVNYSSCHHNYYSAWRYVTKSDSNYIESVDHPDLKNSHEPRTSSASRAKSSRCKRLRKAKQCGALDDTESEEEMGDTDTPSSSKKRKKKRLSAFEVSEIIVEKKLKSLVELQALASEQKSEGKTDLAEFLINRTPRAVADILNSTWQIENAQEKLARSKKTRMQILQEARESECAEGCDGQWQICAEEILTNNGVPVNVFRDAVTEVLSKGRGKYRNIMITGNANCGKTFLLNPLTVIYETFCNPATGSFAWVGVENAECIFLNDFRWSPQIIQWHDLLLKGTSTVITN